MLQISAFSTMDGSISLDRGRAEKLALAIQARRLRDERAELEGNLRLFVERAWSSMDPSQFQSNWALDSLCEHLEAVTSGHIKRLLINFPPRCGKSNVASIAWPAWVWAQSQTSFWAGPQVRFLCGSYNHTLSLQHSNASRRLLASPFFQQYWGSRFKMMSDQNTKTQYDTDKGGKRIATSIGGTLVGLGGDVLLVDDPHNTESVESATERLTVLNWWKELSGTRLNDPKQSAVVVVMQRLHEEDVSGIILKEHTEDWVHLMIPMRYDEGRHCVTMPKPGVVWQDPRIETGETLMWPERYGEKEVKALETKLGPYLASGRLQQSPEPAGGGILKREWWGAYELPVGAHFRHKWDYIVASLDPAFTAKQENDASGFSVWGAYKEAGKVKIVLIHAWKKWLELHGQTMERLANENNAAYVRRTSKDWGLVEWVAHDCNRLRVHTLLVEDKASGHSVAQEIKRLYRDREWGVRLVNPGALDKRARAYAVQHLFADGMIEAPASAQGDLLVFREFAQMTIDECAKFRGLSGDEDNIVDSATQALKFLRDIGVAVRSEEQRSEELELASKRGGPREPIYPV